MCSQFESKLVVKIRTSLGYISRQEWTPAKSEECGTISQHWNYTQLRR